MVSPPASLRPYLFVEGPEVASFEALANDWLRTLHAAGRSLNTIRAYSRAAHRCRAWLAAMGMPVAPAALSAEHLREYLSAMREDGLRRNTISSAEDALRSFWRWLMDQGEVSANPWAHIARQRPEQPPMRPPSPEQMAQVIAAAARRPRAPSSPAWLALRDVAILATLYDTGLRAEELLSLRRRDAAGTQEITVLGKGRRYRTVMLSSNVYAAVRRYLRAYERARGPLPPEAPLWQALRGPLRYSGLHQLVRDAGRAAGVALHPHLIRHAFATHFLDGGDQWALQILLGHSTDATTRRYISTVQSTRALAQHAQFSPARGLRLT